MQIAKTLGKVVIASSFALAVALVNAAPVNINTAGVHALAENINGVGAKKAEAIVAYRKANGPFKSVEELTNVKGIGSKLIEKNKADLYLSDVAMKQGGKRAISN
jgi:competence protein ComEA